MIPDYKNSIVNLSSSILQHFGVKTEHSPLLISTEFKKNIVLIILDGFGYNLLSRYAETECKTLSKFFEKKITSVFPPTTSAAITSILTAKTPFEHGAIGWTLYFKEFAKNIDFLPNWDSITAQTQNAEKYNIYDFVGAESIFSRIAKQNVNQFHITEKYLKNSTNNTKCSHSAKLMGHKSPQHFFKILRKIIKKKKFKESVNFVYSYFSAPDKIEHRNGVFSNSTKIFLQNFDEQLNQFINKTKNADTTILITADHGLIDINKYFYVNEDKPLFDTLIMPTFPEPRFMSFFVKPHKIDIFKKEIAKYEDEFLILSRDEFFEKQFLGNGLMHPKIDDFIGDFVAIAKSNAALKSIYQQNGKWEKEFSAHHAGITVDEMIIPLIKIDL
ncbi:MAG: hypothetical protein HN952_03330 [Candidatus Cloacimonetes bacterium]|jgi:predicted AlkP superfamily pyrophosphatase or phosphodiesterase|nr:hypothetical protein [Candidatus Cloacimonadota bacterium]MBT6993969.1 hypothetical protein [Candidatus Cloacimonadota bacterium]MBT7470029.1 hypothetical protein [Candidatus Cloacimonadota bacterium]